MAAPAFRVDLRKNVRRNSDAAGTIYYNAAYIPCRLENISDGGACVQLASDAAIAPYFVLIVPLEKVERSCFVVWRKGSRIGVQFV